MTTTYDNLQVDIGNAPNDDAGDPLRTAFDKINQRFAELRVFLNNRGDWAPNTVYTANPNRDWVIVDGVGYLATSNHTSGATFAADLAAGKWVEADAIQLRADLGQPDGAKYVGGVDLQLADYAALRAYAGTKTRVYITGALGTAKPAGIAGVFQHDPSDTTGADNGGTVIVGADGRRWKRDRIGPIQVGWFGANDLTLVEDSTQPIQAAVDTASAQGGNCVDFEGKTYKVVGGITVRSKVTLRGIPGATKWLANPNSTAQLLRSGGSSTNYVQDVVIYGIIFDHNSASGTSPVSVSAATIDFSKRLHIEKCVFENSSGYGLGLQSRPTMTPAGKHEDIFLIDCIFRNNGYYAGADPADGLDIKSSARLHARNLYAHNNADKGIDIRCGSGFASGIITHNNGTVGIEIVAYEDLEAFDSNISDVFSYNNGNSGISLVFQAGTTRDLSANANNLTSYGNGKSGIRIVNGGPDSTNRWTAAISNATTYGNAEYGISIVVGANGSSGVVLSNVVSRKNSLGGAIANTSGIHAVNSRFVENTGVGFNSTNNSFVQVFANCDFGGNSGGFASGVAASLFANCVNAPISLEQGFVTNSANYFRAEARAAGGSPRLSVKGTDANINFDVSTKGGGVARFFRRDFLDQMFEMAGATDPNGYLRVISSNAARPALQAQGTATDIDIELTPKGAGLVRFGTRVGTSDVPVTGYIEVKDASGAIRRLAVIG